MLSILCLLVAAAVSPAVASLEKAPIGDPCISDVDCGSSFCFRQVCREVAPQKPFQRQVIIIDNFYNNPDQVRNFILNQVEFNTKGNYPGIRTDSLMTPAIKASIENVLGSPIHYVEGEPYNGAFQYTISTDRSWIHCDLQQWAGVLYLTPNAPVNSGTRFYRHKATRLTETATEDDAKRLGFGSAKEVMDYVYKDSQNYAAWERTDEVANIYNRLILFRGFRWHQSAEYFGTDKYDGRLFQTFFFDV